jgi:hypothetical protein
MTCGSKRTLFGINAQNNSVTRPNKSLDVRWRTATLLSRYLLSVSSHLAVSAHDNSVVRRLNPQDYVLEKEK